MQFFQINFNTLASGSEAQQQLYLYKNYVDALEIGTFTLRVGIKQNINTENKLIFNTIKEAFIKLEDYNANTYQRCLSVETYQSLYEKYGKLLYELEKFFCVLDTRKVTTDNMFSIFLFYNDVL